MKTPPFPFPFFFFFFLIKNSNKFYNEKKIVTRRKYFSLITEHFKFQPNLAMMQFMQEASYLTLSDSDDSCFPLLNDAATTFCAGNTGLGIGNCYVCTYFLSVVNGIH